MLDPNIDLDAFDDWQKAQEEGVEVPIYKPGTRDVLFAIRVAGPDSERFEAAEQRAIEERVAAQGPLSRNEEVEAGARFLARISIAWTLKDRSGKPVKFTEEAATKLFREYKMIRKAVDGVAGNRNRFTPRSSTASAEPSATS
ncbi:hypothetical protein [Methylorubrum extorquens]|uniref:hypothetical protein n=1 Tax=Methylorubrum extorquens TaxID=408 RepID=UPI002238BBEB|nr:hypothetical protein [Methylorubrum extorquens]UYW34478.1 hypothetical protein OKB92_10470 [Methylorubrum extorquens]